MSSAKEIRVEPIDAKAARRLCEKYHYSGSFTMNSQLHLGVFLDGRCEGVMSFGPSLDKRKMLPLVAGTEWNGFLELNRMAFSDRLPKNSESRALSVAFRMIKKSYPHIKWIISFSDGTQCGDGTIYRAAGFVLTGINKNKTLIEWAGKKFTDLSLRLALREGRLAELVGPEMAAKIPRSAIGSMKPFFDAGAKPLEGFQLRYVYFLDPSYRSKLTAPEIPFSKIGEVGASMYKGIKRVGSSVSAASGFQPEEGGANPTSTLQSFQGAE